MHGNTAKVPSIKGKFRLGKLSIVKTTAGKSRVIAITNYWIQVGLKPLHDGIFSILKRLETDGTFDQMKPVKRLFETKSTEEMFYSYDLSAATDRLPIDVQEQILSILLGSRFASE